MAEAKMSLFMDIIQQYADPTSIPYDKLHHLLSSLRDEHSIHWIDKSMIDNLFGMVATHAHTEHPVPHDFNFKLQINKHNITIKGGVIDCTPIPVFLRRSMKVVPFKVATQLEKNFLTTWEDVRELSKLPLSLAEKEKKWHNLINMLKDLPDDIYKSLSRGIKKQLLEFIQQCSPSIYSICLRWQNRSREAWAIEQNQLIPKLLFGLNNAIWEYRQHGQKTDFFNILIEYFHKNTDNDTVPEYVKSEIENCQALTAIILMSNFLIDDLGSMLTRKDNIRLFQIMAKMSMTDVNKHHRVQSLKDTKILKTHYQGKWKDWHKESVSPNLIHTYLTLSELPKWVAVPLEDQEIKLKNPCLTCFDLMAPTGVRLTKWPMYPMNNNVYPMHTYFKGPTYCRTSRCTETLSLRDSKDFLCNIFTSKSKLVFGENVSPHGLYDSNSPNSFSCDNILIGKTFLFYHCTNDKEEFTSGPSKKRHKLSNSDPCITLQLNEYVLQNHYMSKELIVSNIINLCKNWLAISQTCRKAIHVKNNLEQNRDSKPTALVITEGQKNPYIQDHVSNEAFRGQQEFVNELVEIVIRVLQYEEMSDVYLMKVTDIALSVLALQNKHLTLKKGELLDYINPGFGVIWIKTEFTMTEPLIVCRPWAYGNLTGGFNDKIEIIDEKENYTFSMHSAFYRNSIGPGSIYVPNAYQYVRRKNCSTTRRVVDPSNREQAHGAMTMIEQAISTNIVSGEKEFDSWWPVICPPDLNAAMFETANTPVGRLFTHYSSEQDFINNFNNPGIKDIKFRTVFTANEVFSDVANNINTLLLYPKEVLNNKYCPLHKYLTFNASAKTKVDEMMTNAAMVDEQKQYKHLEDHDKAVEKCHSQHDSDNLVSAIIGSAFPMTCWSDSALFQTVRPNKGVIMKDGSFFIGGIDIFETLNSQEPPT